MINIANLLRNAKKGTMLWSPLFGPVKFLSVDSADSTIIVETERETQEWFSACGIYKVMKSHLLYPDSECLLFPGKDYRTWQGWTPCVEPKFKVGDWVVTDYGKVSQVVSVDNAGDGYTLDDGVYFSGSWCDMYHLWSIADVKDGDVLCTYECGEPKIVFIHKLIRKNGSNIFMYYCFYNIMHPRFDANDEPGCLAPKREDVKPATKEQRDLLFSKMQEEGYQWDEKKKELKKIQSHYDIANFEPLDPVLVRQNDSCTWGVSFFGRYSEMFICCSNVCFEQCIPLNEHTKHLLGTTDMPSEEFINW